MAEPSLPARGSNDGTDRERSLAGAVPQLPGTTLVSSPKTLSPLIYIYLSALFVTASELLLKVGVDLSPSRTGWLESPWILEGILTGLASIGCWLAGLRKLPLSIAFIHSNFVHITVPICCWYFLGESINLQRWLGILFVLAGITCIAKPLAAIEESR